MVNYVERAIANAPQPRLGNGYAAYFSPEHNAWVERTYNWPEGTVLSLYQNDWPLADRARDLNAYIDRRPVLSEIRNQPMLAPGSFKPAYFSEEHNAWAERLYQLPAGSILQMYQEDEYLQMEPGRVIGDEILRRSALPDYSEAVVRQGFYNSPQDRRGYHIGEDILPTYVARDIQRQRYTSGPPLRYFGNEPTAAEERWAETLGDLGFDTARAPVPAYHGTHARNFGRSLDDRFNSLNSRRSSRLVRFATGRSGETTIPDVAEVPLRWQRRSAGSGSGVMDVLASPPRSQRQSVASGRGAGAMRPAASSATARGAHTMTNSNRFSIRRKPLPPR